MSAIYSTIIPGPPVAQGRARLSRSGHHTMHPASREWRTRAVAHIRAELGHRWTPLHELLAVDVVVSLPRPKVPMIAALYVQPRGCYASIEGVDPWDEARDARTYAGPYPVVAHPPCASWGRYAKGTPESSARGPLLGDDAGTFAAALASVERFGGILEHPRDSKRGPATASPCRTRPAAGHAALVALAGPAWSTKGTTATPHRSRRGSTTSGRASPPRWCGARRARHPSAPEPAAATSRACRSSRGRRPRGALLTP